MSALGTLPGTNLVGDEAGPRRATFGVDVVPVLSAPFGEVVRVNVCTDDSAPSALLEFAASFGLSQPLWIGPGEFLAVLEQRPQAVVGLGAVPRETDDDQRGVGHGTASLLGVEGVKPAVGA